MEISVPREGSIVERLTLEIPERLASCEVVFSQGDAHHDPASADPFDVVLMVNLIDRLGDPAACLRRMAGLCRRGGQLVVVSPFTWMKEVTPPANWLGGFRDPQGADRTTVEGITQLLLPDFSLVRQLDLPFLIPEHARKYQWSVASAMTFCRN